MYAMFLFFCFAIMKHVVRLKKKCGQLKIYFMCANPSHWTLENLVQVDPLLEEIRIHNPNFLVLLTFGPF